MTIYILIERYNQDDFTCDYGECAAPSGEVIGVFDSYEKAHAREREKRELYADYPDDSDPFYVIETMDLQ